MVLILLKNGNQIQNFGDDFREYPTSYMVLQNSGVRIYCSKQNTNVVEYTGDFPFEDFEPGKYMFKNGRIVEDSEYVRPSDVNEYGIPEDVIQNIEQTAVNKFLEELAEELTTGYRED